MAAALALLALGAGCGDGGGPPSEPAADTMLGVIEGFYGPLYTFGQRLDLLRFLPRARLNTYVYAPKSDPYHRTRWRDPYPPEWVAHFADLARAASEIGVRFVFALSPGSRFDPNGGDQAAIERKLATLSDAGVRHFCLLFDDLSAASAAAEPSVQVAVVTETLAFLRQRDADGTLCFISHYYAGTAAELRGGTSPFDGTFAAPSSVAYAAYAAIPTEVPILWTGPRVFNRLTVGDTADFHDLVGRPVLIWDNYPVNDVVLSRELFLGPYREREAGLADVADGVLLNTMLQPEASKIALWTAGRFFAEGERYDPDSALTDALEALAGDHAGARVLARLVAHFQSHPLIGDQPESAALAERADAFFSTGSETAERALRVLFASYATVVDDLARDVHNAALVAELGDAARKLSLLGEAGLLALDLLGRRGRGEPVDDTELRQRLAMAERISWLVGANTAIGPPLDTFLSGRAAVPADVFGDFFARVAAVLAGP